MEHPIAKTQKIKSFSIRFIMNSRMKYVNKEKIVCN